jgi:hypothetical protein
MNRINLPTLHLSFSNSLIITIFFFVATPLIITTSLLSLTLLNNNPTNKNSSQHEQQVLSAETSGMQIFASLPSSFPSISGEVLAADARGEIIKDYLSYYNSPLLPYAYLIVNTADKYGIDFRLTTAIAQQESNLCKNYPEGTYNCWGWGIHSRGTLAFSSFEEAIETVTKGLKEDYLDKGLLTPDAIMTKYTPLSNGSWAFGVDKFLNELQ